MYKRVEQYGQGIINRGYGHKQTHIFIHGR